MNGNEFLESMNEVDPALLDIDVKKHGKKLAPNLRWLLVVAAAFILFGGVTVHALNGGFRVKKVTTLDENGFTVSTSLNKIKWSRFKGEIREAPEKIAEQIKNYVPAPPESSFLSLPEVYIRGFNSISEAIAYIGLKTLKVPVLEISDGVRPGVAAWADRDTQQMQFVNLVVNDINGEPEHVNMQMEIVILTDKYEGDEYKTGGVWTKNYNWKVDFEEYSTKNGNACQLVVIDNKDMQRHSLTAYVTTGDALYKLHLAFYNTMRSEAYRILDTWVDSLY